MIKRLFCLLALFPAVVAVRAQDPFPPGFFKFKKIINPDRTYFQELSDNEYDSLDPGPVFYPFILDAWPTRPITAEEFFSLEMPQHTPDRAVDLQKYILDTRENPLERANTVSFLAICRSRTAIPLLVAGLRQETDAQVVSDYLLALAALHGKLAADVLVPRLTGKVKRQRFAAAKLYALQTYADVKLLLDLAGKEKEKLVRLELYRAAAANAKKSTFAVWQPVIKRKLNADELAVITPALYRFAELTQHREQVLTWCRQGKPALRLALAQSCRNRLSPELARAVLETLSRDTLSSVRAETAAAIGRLALKDRLPQLLALAKDKRPNVRLEAAGALRFFPVVQAFDQLIVLTGDRRSPLTRIAARKSLIAMAGKYPVDAEIGTHINHANEDTRYNTFLVLAALDSKRYGPQIEARLQGESRDLNQAAAIRALIAAGHAAAEDTILGFAESEAPDVRTSVGEAVGRLKLRKGHDRIIKYTLNDTDADVRWAANISLGLIHQESFAGTFLKVLERTNYAKKPPEFLSARDRVAACWGLSRLKDPGKAVYKRLDAQISRPVVKIPMMPPTFDSSEVRISAGWALVTIGKRTQNKSVLDRAHRMLQILGREDNLMASGMAPPTGKDLRYYSKQAQLFLDGDPHPRLTMALTEFKFNLRPARKPRR